MSNNNQVRLLALVFSTVMVKCVDDLPNLRLRPDDTVMTFLSTQHTVYHIQEDLFIPGNLLFTDRHALKTTDGTRTHTIAGSALSYGYVEGVGSAARFENIRQFLQLTENTVLAVDTQNHCLRTIDRESKRTSPYLGKCENRGYSNGGDPSFYLPMGMVSDLKNISYIILADWGNRALRYINTATLQTRTLIQSLTLDGPRGIAQDWSSGNLYITTDYSVVMYDYVHGYLTIIAGSRQGYRDGHLSQSLFSLLFGITFLAPGKLVVADTLNNRLRVIDLETNMTSAICSSIAGNRDGGITSCQLSSPNAVLTVGSRLYIGEYLTIRFLQGEDDESIPTTVQTTTQARSSHRSTLPLMKTTLDTLKFTTTKISGSSVSEISDMPTTLRRTWTTPSRILSTVSPSLTTTQFSDSLTPNDVRRKTDIVAIVAGTVWEHGHCDICVQCSLIT